MSDLANAYEFVDWLRRARRSRSERERKRARRIDTNLERLDREIAAALARRRR